MQGTRNLRQKTGAVDPQVMGTEMDDSQAPGPAGDCPEGQGSKGSRRDLLRKMERMEIQIHLNIIRDFQLAKA